MTLDRLSDALWRVRLSRTRPGLAHLALTDHRSNVTCESLIAALDQAQAMGATRVRTSALFGESRPTLAAAGFHDVERLVLLQRSLSPDWPIDQSSTSSDRPPLNVRIQPLRTRHLGAAARIDAAAFGPHRSTGRDELAAVLEATTWSWGQVASTRRWPQSMVGFVLCGAADSDAYIQRLAVHPTRQRHGVASTLMRAVLSTMSQRGFATVMVNTRPDNAAALELYQRWGFRRLRHELVVAERQL